MQPFRVMNEYYSSCWTGLYARLSDDGERIMIESPDRMRTLSSAIYRGGMSSADRFINWRVPLTYNNDDPHTEILDRLEQWGIEHERAIVLMTAAKLTHASVAEYMDDRFKLVCMTTAGTRNAARAGSERTIYESWRPGTINTFLLFDGQLTDAAMVNAMMTAVEAKAAALQDIGLRDSDNGLAATGTTTDAIVLGVSGKTIYHAIHEYAGTATTVGAAIGQLVYDTVYESVVTQHEE
ncbi:adenosylcobinamide amidohydrolase [Paenibacillus xylaniclasticus]|uniref:adenosylcobinamide amidohydrolase n=1 Tax=Paenibacillus xylaniclasticus TaxID=588083 RepID=UPI000FD910CB|nr:MULTISPECIES: adenosylcobinamide amidohydrolase [Paenibacillus]GFN31790.1 adenosylcobinamide amidohydrolase [Paenibacillus curdlanolyticus]